MKAALFFVILLLIPACRDNATGIAQRAHRTLQEQLIPLSIGNWWRYDWEERESGARGSLRQTLQYGGAMADRLNRWNEEDRAYQPAGTSFSYSFIEEDSLLGMDLAYYDDGDERGLLAGFQPDGALSFDRFYWYSLPAGDIEPGNVFRMTSDDGGIATAEWLAVDTPVETPAGSFRCALLRLSMQQPKGEAGPQLTRYFARGTGIVRMDYEFVRDGGREQRVYLLTNLQLPQR